MADFTFNQALGRVVEFYMRVRNNDPANSALVLVVLKATAAADDTLRDKATLADVLAVSPEATNAGYARKVLSDTTLAATSPDNAADAWQVTFPSQTWNTVGATGGAWAKLLVCYDKDTTAGTDADIIPVTAHDLAVTPNGQNITVTPPSTGFFRAT